MMDGVRALMTDGALITGTSGFLEYEKRMHAQGNVHIGKRTTIRQGMPRFGGCAISTHDGDFIVSKKEYTQLLPDKKLNSGIVPTLTHWT